MLDAGRRRIGFGKKTPMPVLQRLWGQLISRDDTVAPPPEIRKVGGTFFKIKALAQSRLIINHGAGIRRHDIDAGPMNL